MASCLTARQKLVSDGLGATVVQDSFCSLTALAACLFAAVIGQAVLALALARALRLASFVFDAGNAGLGFNGHQQSTASAYSGWVFSQA